MLVVDRQKFLALPAGTIYCKGSRWHFGELCIKGDSLPNDWSYCNPAWASAHDSGAAMDLMEKSLSDGSSFASEADYGRDGYFDDDAIFLVFQKPDLLLLREAVDVALGLE